MSAVKTTKHASLQAQLNTWHDILLRINESRRTLDASTTDGLRELRTLMDEFVTSFVPADIDEEDMSHYANNLITDEEFFVSLVREIGQCATGEAVESIEERDSRVVFFLYPPEGTLGEAADFELYRELAFVKQTTSEGDVWRAEG